jgi:23S rRNA pseudouridine1911/1915/1917 synthase
MQEINLKEQIPFELAGERFDQVAAQLFPDYSRARLQSWIKSGELTLDGQTQKPKLKVMGGEWLEVRARLERSDRWEAQDIALDIVFEDEDILVINKPAGLVVHPAAGHADGTLLNALLHHVPALDTVPRAGIVHRLDKDTTGLMVVAKNLISHTSLVEQLQAREVGREYEAVTFGVMTGGGRVDEPIGRHPHQRKKMAVVATGKEAATNYEVVERFREHTHVRLKLETGRTHQIRVHMAHIKYPLIGDPLYSGRPRLPRGATNELVTFLQGFRRQALHARRLRLVHPSTYDEMEWQADLPEDMQQLLQLLREDSALFAESE